MKVFSILLLVASLFVFVGCGPSEKELQQQAAQKAEAARLQYNKELAAKVAADAAEEAAYQAAYAKRAKDSADCEARYWCGDDTNRYTGSRCDTEARYDNNDNLKDSTKLDACLKAVWDDDTPENRMIEAHKAISLARDQKHIQEVLANDPYAFCGMVEGAACRH